VSDRRQPARIFDIEARYVTVLDVKDVVDRFVEQQLTFEVFDDLMNLHRRGSISGLRDLHRIDARIDRRPLLCPIRPDRRSPMDVASIHTVRPSYVFRESREDRVDVARVEASVKLLDKLWAVHQVRPPMVFVDKGPLGYRRSTR